MEKPSIAVVGPGRAGSALGRALHLAGYPVVAVAGRNPGNVRALADELGARPCATPAGALDMADLTILAVPDDVVGAVAEDIAGSVCGADGRSAVHLSGAQDREPLRPLRGAGLQTGVFHPLQSFRRGPGAVQNVDGTSFGIDAELPLRATLWVMAEGIGGHPFDLSRIDRVRYHIAAVLVANYPVTLLAAAETLMAEAGLDEGRAHSALLALLNGTMNNVRATGAREALTGPAARGDQGTIRRHLHSLANDRQLQEIYRLLAERSTTLKEES